MGSHSRTMAIPLLASLDQSSDSDSRHKLERKKTGMSCGGDK